MIFKEGVWKWEKYLFVYCGYYLRGINNSGENYGLAQILSGLMERRQPPDIKSKATWDFDLKIKKENKVGTSMFLPCFRNQWEKTKIGVRNQ